MLTNLQPQYRQYADEKKEESGQGAALAFAYRTAIKSR
jgi:hypothetical protein